ncbi:MAG: prolyl oligopeptidase family serine peptidase [Acidimicrobiales bacterium]
MAAPVPPAPPARTNDVADTLHGVTVADPYRWLEDGDTPATEAWTETQNLRTRTVLDALPGRSAMHGRLTSLLRAGNVMWPRVRGGQIFSLDRWGDHDQAVLVVRPTDSPGPASPRVLVDPHALTGDPTAALDWFHPSWDGRLVAYGVSAGGDERSTLRVIDVESGDHLPDEIPDTRAASVAWWADGSGFAYARYPAGEEYGRHIRTHRLGEDPAGDQTLFAAPPDPAAWPEVAISQDGRWYTIHVAHGWSRVDVYVIERSTGATTTVIEGYEVITLLEVVGDRLIGATTLDADRGRVVAAALAAPTPANWSTLVPEGEAVIEGVAVTPSSLVVASTRRATSRLTRYRHEGSEESAIPLPELGALAGLSASKEEELAAFSFTGFTRPPTLFRWTPGDGVVQWSSLPGGPDPAGYEIEQVTYPSTDGTPIAMFLARAAGAARASDTPTILTAYGGFGVTMAPAWSPLIVSHCDAGGSYAVACIRGGAEEGEAWHRAGMREHKQQVFDDFCAAADWLVSQGYTSRDRLAIRGGSNGGLLMGAAVTQRPDLCRAVHCAVPLLDMVRYHHFRIAKLWIPEYGDPDVPDEFAWLYAYSPYHHIVDGTCYPAMLITTAEEDSRVDPNHARKFAARIQAATSCGDDRPILVRIETRAGHGQGKPVTKQADELADVAAFLHWQLDVTAPG